MKILMVCLGNICRSPLAQGIMENYAPNDWHIDSAGTSGWHASERPDTRSILIAKERGITIDQQRSRQVTVEDFEVFDIIFAMDSSNHSNLIQRAPDESAKNKVRLLLNEAYPGENRQVPDPYTGGQEGFSHVYELLEEAIQSFLRAH
ncbi:MAG: protein-tyrosine-phosphatase [Cryomorphaceae bacterium]|nr:protein-tyrosine-phosphatase [Cryomorphaceae bacterium]